jgi:hypothetical protein
MTASVPASVSKTAIKNTVGSRRLEAAIYDVTLPEKSWTFRFQQTFKTAKPLTG